MTCKILSLALLLAATAAQASWVPSWGSAQQIPEDRNTLPSADLTDATLRQVVRLSIGGTRLRVVLSNAFGTAPLTIDAAHIARAGAPGSAAIVAGTDRALTFNGASSVIIPAGASYMSDPVDIAAAPLTRYAVSLHFPQAPAQQTSHPGSRTTSWTTHGNATAAQDLPDAKPVEHWFQLTAIEVDAPAKARTVVAFGDSITDGRGATTNQDNRWPDILAERLQASPATRAVAVVNKGIGGNRVLLDGAGPNALARFERDVLAQPGVSHFILLEGINDIGTFTRDGPQPPEAHAALVARITGAYAQMVARARAAGIKAIGATILPYAGSDYARAEGASDADRQAVNRWIRTPGNFDAVVDLDAVIRDPAQPDRMRADYDSGDHLHPSAAGYKAMAEAIPLSLLAR